MPLGRPDRPLPEPGTRPDVAVDVARRRMPATRAGRDAGRVKPSRRRAGVWQMNGTGDTDNEFTRGLIRAGVLVLPLGGALKLLGNLGTFDSIGYGVPQASEAATVSTPAFFVGELVGSLVPVLLHSVRLAGGVLGLAAGVCVARVVRHELARAGTGHPARAAFPDTVG